MSVGFGYCAMYCYTSLSGCLSSALIITKPVISYLGLRFIWLTGIAVIEWWSARLYSINCIGEGFNGFYNHIWNLASPSCTGLLTTHIGLMGVLVASVVITFLWSIYSIINKITENKISNDVIKEYNDIKNIVCNKK